MQDSDNLKGSFSEARGKMAEFGRERTGIPEQEDRESYWEALYKCDIENPLPDNWLECFMYLFKKESRILELGCGKGYLSEYLIKNGFNVLSTDISGSVLEGFKSRVPEASVLKLDLSRILPFNDSSFDIIIADLCLHYFSHDETVNILKEINRIMAQSGYLLARVNSEKDINYGAGDGIELEKSFFNQNGHYKRFFSRETAEYFFKDWSSISVSEKTTSKYISEKHVLQIIAEK